MISSMRWKRLGVGQLVALGGLGCAITVPAVPVHALGMPPWLVCADSKEAAELSVPHIALPAPPNGATVLAGTPVTFSGEYGHALTFSVASSPALLSSPDIDSGLGSLQPGTSLYTFTSTKATAIPRTIYWAASFTFTPEDCESPSTFTTPVRTLTVVSPSPTEEVVVTKNREAEPAADIGSVSLDAATIRVQGSHEAGVKLACAGAGACSGKLTLTAKSTKGDASRKGAKASSVMTTIGSARFSISASTTAMVKLTLNAIGRALLKVDHGRLSSILTILESSPASSQTHTATVQLVQQKAAKAKKRNSKAGTS
jgi:hypothetical protein